VYQHLGQRHIFLVVELDFVSVMNPAICRNILTNADIGMVLETVFIIQATLNISVLMMMMMMMMMMMFC